MPFDVNIVTWISFSIKSWRNYSEQAKMVLKNVRIETTHMRTAATHKIAGFSDEPISALRWWLINITHIYRRCAIVATRFQLLFWELYSIILWWSVCGCVQVWLSFLLVTFIWLSSFPKKVKDVDGNIIGEEQISVEEHYHKVYALRLKYPHLPALDVGRKKKPTYIPLEVHPKLPSVKW